MYKYYWATALLNQYIQQCIADGVAAWLVLDYMDDLAL